MIALDSHCVTRAGDDDCLGITRNIARTPGNRLVRIQLNVFFLSDTPAVTAAAPELIITSQMRMQPLHEYSWHRTNARSLNIHFSTHMYFLVALILFCCLTGRGAAAGLRGPGAQSGCGDTDHEGRAGRCST